MKPTCSQVSGDQRRPDLGPAVRLGREKRRVSGSSQGQPHSHALGSHGPARLPPGVPSFQRGFCRQPRVRPPSPPNSCLPRLSHTLSLSLFRRTRYCHQRSEEPHHGTISVHGSTGVRVTHLQGGGSWKVQCPNTPLGLGFAATAETARERPTSDPVRPLVWAGRLAASGLLDPSHWGSDKRSSSGWGRR